MARIGTSNDDLKPRDYTRRAVVAAVGLICAGWDGAMDARDARGYPRQSPGLRSVPTEVRLDPLDPYQMHPAAAAPSAFGDSTGGAALVEDAAQDWLQRARSALVILLSVSGAGAQGESRWTGPFHPPSFSQTLGRAAEELCEWWPKGAGKLCDRLIQLGDEARRRFVEHPKTDEETLRGNRLEVCDRCGGTIVGNTEDRIRRINGRPFHAVPCFDAVVASGVPVDPDGCPLCTACATPVREALRHIDGRPFHALPCYETERKRRRRAADGQ